MFENGYLGRGRVCVISELHVTFMNLYVPVLLQSEHLSNLINSFRHSNHRLLSEMMHDFPLHPRSLLKNNFFKISVFLVAPVVMNKIKESWLGHIQSVLFAFQMALCYQNRVVDLLEMRDISNYVKHKS